MRVRTRTCLRGYGLIQGIANETFNRYFRGMLSENLYTIHQIIRGDICTMDALDWFMDLDAAKQRSIVLQMRTCIEEMNPTPEEIDKLSKDGYLNGSPDLAKIFKAQPYKEAITFASEVPDEDLGKSFYLFITVLRYFDEVQLKTICKDGCDHPGHNLYWEFRTDDIEKVAGFYSLFGFKLEHHTYTLGQHYSMQAGQSLLKIREMTKTLKEKGLSLRIKFLLHDFDGVINTLKEKQISFLTEPTQTETGLMAVVLDPDGRKVQLHKLIQA